LWLTRGFTSHEHLPHFNLINMNGRIYDPLTGRMCSPDNNVQLPDFTQNYNRFSYALNNPLKITDPDGEFLVLDSWIVGFIHGFFSQGDNRGSAGWETANRFAKNDARIWGGLLHTDSNKSGVGRIWEIISRFTWQLPQTVAGVLVNLGLNTFGQTNSVHYGYGVTVTDNKFSGGAFTVGNYIAGPSGFRPDWRDHLFVHEYGHYRQSQRFGPLYLPVIALPSLTDFYLVDELFNQNLHETRWYEAGASRSGANYFDKHEGSGKEGFVAGNSMFFNKNSFITGSGTSYTNPRNGGRNRFANPTKYKFHWTDIPVHLFAISPLAFFIF
jgi:RHS repeat-associated protein